MTNDFDEDLMAHDSYRNPRYIRLEPMRPRARSAQHEIGQAMLLGVVGLFTFLAVLTAIAVVAP